MGFSDRSILRYNPNKQNNISHKCLKRKKKKQSVAYLPSYYPLFTFHVPTQITHSTFIHKLKRIQISTDINRKILASNWTVNTFVSTCECKCVRYSYSESVDSVHLYPQTYFCIDQHKLSSFLFINSVN